MNNNTKRIIEQLKKGLDITNIQLADALSDIDSDSSGSGGGSAFEDYTDGGGTKPKDKFLPAFVESVDNSVLTSKQTLNDGQKTQARTNIDAEKATIVENIQGADATLDVKGGRKYWIYPLIKGATYKLNYRGSVTKDIGSIYLCSLCKLEGDYVTMPREDVAEKIFSWNNTDSINQGGEFKVPLETDKDCIVITGLRDTYDPNITVKLVKIE